ncbi:MAG: c-type cytochrome [Rhodothermales bacterium]|nr:c-type cytochrome [Rhodothermales bacterium]
MSRSPLYLFLAFALLGASCSGLDASKSAKETPPTIQLPAGFSYDHLYSPSDNEQGTWVSLTFDDKGRLIASDQHGGLYRITMPPIGAPGETVVEPIALEIGKAHGLLWAFNSLYVVVNTEEGLGGYNSGLYRVFDTDNDDTLDKIETLHTFEGAGEHGPHSLVVAPDGETLYLLAGNHTDVPAFENSLLPAVWEEDQLVPRIVDPRGHAIDRMAPGGWVARMDENGKGLEIVSAGFRNAFDLAFNQDDELFVFDADMEWDLGMPWYRPIRLNHATSGSEFGWRTGSGKWPAYYPDNLPAVVDIGQGSPTSVLMGTPLKFPQRYQRGIFLFDWSFGTIYWVDLIADGSTYRGEFEEFLSGVPLPVTDGVAGPDGAFYFASGGRNLESHLYRVYYTGAESTDPVTFKQPSRERDTRKMLEAFHGRRDAEAVSTAWFYLSHPDRFIRYAARVAIEHQPVDTWKNRVMIDPDPIRRINSVIALAHQGDASMRDGAIDALWRVDYSALTEAQQLDLIRAYGLVFIRLGAPEGVWRQRVVDQLAPAYPADTESLNRELSRMLAYLGAPGVNEATLTLLESARGGQGEVPILSEALTARSEQYGKAIVEMRTAMPSAQEIAYAYNLSHSKETWSETQLRRYFQWFFEALQKNGGASYRPFLENVRANAIENLPESQLEAIADLVGEMSGQQGIDFAALPQPVGPGKNWNRGEVSRLLQERIDEGKEVRDIANGQRMFEASLCGACHTIQGQGGNIGPELSGVGNRFSRNDLVTAITLPSEAVSDQYASSVFTRKDGSQVMGRAVKREGGVVAVNVNPFDPTTVITLQESDIAGEEISKISPMPARLIDRLNEEEMLDLMVYLLAGGNAEHELYHPENASE